MTDNEEFYALTFPTIRKKPLSFNDLRGKIVIVINTATKCGFTPQLAAFETLHQKYKDRGVVILGFPSNQQEIEEEGIEQECSLNYGVTFTLMSLSDVNGDNANPVFAYLKQSKPGILGFQAIKWNFEKFLIDRHGNVVSRYSSAKTADAIEDDIKKLLYGTMSYEIGNLYDFEDGKMKEVVLPVGKILVHKLNGHIYATSHLCPHYKAPLMKGVLSEDGRITCPWHGACFDVKTGDIEDAPSVDSLISYLITVKAGKVFVSVTEEQVKLARKLPKVCKKSLLNSKTVVILGGGAAGLIACETLREKNFSGKIILISKEPHLPIDRPKLSKSLKIDVSKILLRNQAHFESLDIEVHLSTEATAVNAHTQTIQLSNGTHLQFDFLIIATGGSPRTIPIPGKDLSNIHVIRTISDTAALEVSLSQFAKPNVVIVGSSFIGMEAASVLAKSSIVTIIGMETEPFERVLGSTLGNAFAGLFANSGITLKMGTVVESFVESQDGKVGAVVLKGGEVVAADIVIIGAGVIPNTAFLKDSGIVVDRDEGVTVQASLNVKEFPNVFAAGDVARYPYHLTGDLVRVEHWNIAQNHGRLAASNIAALATSGAVTPFKKVPYFWTSFLGKSVRYAGHAHSFDDVIIEGSINPENLGFVAFFVKDDKVLAIASLAKDPVVSHGAELLRLGKFPEPKKIREGLDILTVRLRKSFFE
ncbi:hypothetical protein HK096_003745 [Nowakowskiella sp. JEL0078]|nr:hypothetical protein HK096_003745 [Nowakowskiella sp. JEL0078]